MTASQSLASTHGRRSDEACPGETHGSPGIRVLAQRWRGHAATLRAYGAAPQAEVLEKCAAELEDGVQEWYDESLTLAEAAGLSGYSIDHLGRLVREGKIPNAGRPGAPRIARGDLPIRANAVAPPARSSELDRTQIVRSAIGSGD